MTSNVLTFAASALPASFNARTFGTDDCGDGGDGDGDDDDDDDGDDDDGDGEVEGDAIDDPSSWLEGNDGTGGDGDDDSDDGGGGAKVTVKVIMTKR